MGFLGPMPILVLRGKTFPISDVPADIMYFVISTECGHQILVTKINDERNIPNICVLSSKCLM